jgi:hypothetical protein
MHRSASTVFRISSTKATSDVAFQKPPLAEGATKMVLSLARE